MTSIPRVDVLPPTSPFPIKRLVVFVTSIVEGIIGSVLPTTRAGAARAAEATACSVAFAAARDTTSLSTSHAATTAATISRQPRDQDTELAAFSASATRFNPARALLHGSSHIGSPTILPAPVASITTRGLSTVIPGAGAASAAETPFRAPRAGTRSSLASDPPASVQCPSSSFMGRGIFRVSRSVVADVIDKGVPSTIADASRVAGARHSRECHGWDTDLQGSRPEQY